MEIISWLVLGLIVGMLSNLCIANEDRGSMLVSIILGMTGVFAGILIGTLSGFGQLTGYSLVNLFLATSGAMLLNFLYQQLRT